MLWSLLLACTPTPTPTDEPLVELLSLRAVTFNTGTTTGLQHDPSFDGYGPDQAEISDAHYGDGLAWQPALDAVAAFIEATDPDIVAFQEIFDPTDCATIPTELHAGFVCETWTPDQGHVAEMVTGPEYAVFCHPDKTDKCVAVHQRLGAPQGPMQGREIEGCGSGARVARLDIPDVGNVVSVHGSSGFGLDDIACRVRQVEAVFDGEDPLVQGAVNLVLGDLNTDPGRAAGGDDSADAWNLRVDGDPFAWITDASAASEPTYQGLAAIDHMASDAFTGTCTTPGASDGPAAVYPGVYFDHHPVVCDISRPR